MTPEQEERFNDFQRRFDAAYAANDREALAELRKEAAAEVVKEGGAHFSQLQQMAELLERGITWEFLAVIQTAKAMGADYVPVSFLQVIADSPKATVTQYWKELQEYDGLIDYGVPDDISGLEGL